MAEGITGTLSETIEEAHHRRGGMVVDLDLVPVRLRAIMGTVEVEVDRGMTLERGDRRVALIVVAEVLVDFAAGWVRKRWRLDVSSANNLRSPSGLPLRKGPKMMTMTWEQHANHRHPSTNLPPNIVPSTAHLATNRHRNINPLAVTIIDRIRTHPLVKTTAMTQKTRDVVGSGRRGKSASRGVKPRRAGEASHRRNLNAVQTAKRKKMSGLSRTLRAALRLARRGRLQSPKWQLQERS